MPVEFPKLGLPDSHWDVLCDTVFPEALEAKSIVKAVRYCQARKINVFNKPVAIIPMWSVGKKKFVETVWPGIKELLIQASRSGLFAGKEEVIFGPIIESELSGFIKERGEWTRRTITIKHPEWASVTVYKIVGGVRCPFTEKVLWLETYAKMGNHESKFPAPAWIHRPKMQLGKCALAASLRVAFPEEIEYCAEEMEGRRLEDCSVDLKTVTDEIVDEVQTVPELPANFDMTMIRPKALDLIKNAIARCKQIEGGWRAAASLFKERLSEIEFAYAISELNNAAERMADASNLTPHA